MSDPNVKAVSLYNLFHDRSYLVPQFQRGYAWGEDQIKDLLMDLESFFTEEKDSETNYILGQIIVSPTDDVVRKTGYKHSLIDGQQRATTLLLLFSAMQELFTNFSEKFPAEDWNSELLDLRNLITFQRAFGRPRIPRVSSPYGLSDEVIEAYALGATPPIPKTESGTRIVAAYQQIIDYLAIRFPDDQRNDFRNFFYILQGRVFLVVLTVESAVDALEIFERINNRGLPLDAADLLKNLLFQAADETLFDTISKKWSAALTELHQIKAKRLTSMVYLLRALALRSGQNIAQNKVYDYWKTVLRQQPQAVTPLDLVNDVAQESKILVNVAKGVGPVGAAPELSSGSNYLGILQHVPILMQAWHLGPVLYSEVASILEERVVLFALARERTAAFENYVPIIMRELSLLDSSSTKQDVEQAFALAEAASIRNDLIARAQVGVNALSYMKPADRKRQRYLLARIARLAQFEGGIPVVSWDDFLKKPTANTGYHMDHVHPQSIQVGISNGNSIGNLVLLEAPLNIGAGNALPNNSVKSVAYSNSGLFLNQILAGATSQGRPNNQVPIIDRFRNLLNTNLINVGAVSTDPGNCLNNWDDQTIQAMGETYWEIFRSGLRYASLK